MDQYSPTAVATVTGALNGAFCFTIFRGWHPAAIFAGLMFGGMFGSTIGNVMDQNAKPGGIVGDVAERIILPRRI